MPDPSVHVDVTPNDQAPDEAPPGAPPTITPTVAAHVLWVYGETAPAGLGMEPGSFVRALIEAFRVADPLNQARLAQGFGSYYLAVRVLNASGPEGLRRIAAELRTHTRVGIEEEARAASRGFSAEWLAVREVLDAELEDISHVAVSTLAHKIVEAATEERRRTGPTWLTENFIPREHVTVLVGAVRQLWDYLQGPVGALIDQTGVLVDPPSTQPDWPGPELSVPALHAVHDVLDRYGITVTDPLAVQLLQELAAARHVTQAQRDADLEDRG